MAPNFYFKMLGGLDFDQTDIVMVSDRLSDNESEEEFNIVDAKANLTLLSLRTGGHMAYILDPVGFSFGLNLLIPLSEASRGIEGSSDDPNGTRLEGIDQIDDLEAAMAVSKSSVGLEIVLSTFVIF
jgi:hypothetical protein